MYKFTRLLSLKTNTLGRDFAVGDIHGHITKLFDQLEKISFDFSRDRLICVGDLIDRGPESSLALDLMNQDWFFSVLGNHEYLMLSALKYKNSEHRLTWISNGGDWIVSTDPGDWAAWFNQIEKMPLAIEVTSKSGLKYGVIHADYSCSSWLDITDLSEEEIFRTIWSRSSFQKKDDFVVSDIDLIVHGHNIHEGELQLGNRLYIDQGAYLGNNFIIKELV